VFSLNWRWLKQRPTSIIPSAPASASTTAEERLQRLNAPCPKLGIAHETLSSQQRKKIRSLLDEKTRLWKSGETPAPSQAAVYTTESEVGTRARSVAVVMPRYVNCDPACLDNDIAYHVSRSAQDCGLLVRRFDADAITYQGSEYFATELQRLESFVSAFRPDIVATDANYLPTPRSLDAKILLEMKKRHGFSILSIVPDCYDAVPNWLGYWGDVADASVIFHRYTRHYREFAKKDAVLVCPTLPFHEATFHAHAKKDIDLSYIGSDNRNRRDFIEAAMRHGINCTSFFHNRRRDQAPSLEEFTNVLGRSKMTFNNGWIPYGINIITGRVGESILSSATLLQEVGSPIDDYLVPFVHYVPVAGLHQFVCFAQFLVEDDGRRQRMAEECRSFWLEHYSSQLFWNKVLTMLPV
jgi:hypothetical protein